MCPLVGGPAFLQLSEKPTAHDGKSQFTALGKKKPGERTVCVSKTAQWGKGFCPVHPTPLCFSSIGYVQLGDFLFPSLNDVPQKKGGERLCTEICGTV